MSHVIRKKRHVASCRHPVCRNWQIKQSDIFWKKPPWIRLRLFPVHELLVKFPSKGYSMPQSWRQFLDQPAAVESDVAPGENHGSPENIPASYSIFLFDNASFKKKHVAPWRPVLHLPSLLPGTNKPSHKSDSINGSDPLCIWLASWWTTYYQSSMAQALPLKSDVSSGHSCKQPPRPRWAWPMHSLEASELDPTDGKCQTGLYIRCSPLNMEWSSRKQPPSETGKLCIEQKQFRVSLYKHEAASTWKKIQSKFLGDHIVESYLPLYLLVWGSRPIGSSLQQHTVFFDSGLVSRNNASAKSQAYRINETWKKYNKYKQKNKTLLTLHITIRF